MTPTIKTEHSLASFLRFEETFALVLANPHGSVVEPDPLTPGTFVKRFRDALRGLRMYHHVGKFPQVTSEAMNTAWNRTMTICALDNGKVYIGPRNQPTSTFKVETKITPQESRVLASSSPPMAYPKNMEDVVRLVLLIENSVLPSIQFDRAALLPSEDFSSILDSHDIGYTVEGTIYTLYA